MSERGSTQSPPIESPEQTIAAVGEFELIGRLTGRLSGGTGVVVGIGDDTAALEPRPGSLVLATTDGQVEGVHFRRDGTPARAVGYRAMATNLSDIAAMGGTPRWALVALTLPADLPLGWIDEMYAGMAAIADEHAVAIVGGNMARTSGPIVIDVTLLGEVAAEQRLTRSGARVGNVIVVTGAPGESAGGLELILRPEWRAGLSAADAETLLARHRTPRPRVAAGGRLAALDCVTSAIDISDGLTADLGHVLDASGVGATLEEVALPITPALRALETAGGPDAVDLTLHGGEAYELLFTCPREDLARVIAALAEDELKASPIGTIEAAPGLRLRRADGQTEAIAPTGHDHFARRRSHDG